MDVSLLTTHLFKLFHGEHLLSELKYQVLPHRTDKHLSKKKRECEMQITTYKHTHTPYTFTLIKHTDVHPLLYKYAQTHSHLLNRLLYECFRQDNILP